MWDQIPTEVLACIMPLLIKMREDTSLTFFKEDFVAKLSGIEIVAVYNKVPLLKILETMREEEKLKE